VSYSLVFHGHYWPSSRRNSVASTYSSDELETPPLPLVWWSWMASKMKVTLRLTIDGGFSSDYALLCSWLYQIGNSCICITPLPWCITISIEFLLFYWSSLPY
jgi:hypothetical protein